MTQSQVDEILLTLIQSAGRETIRVGMEYKTFWHATASFTYWASVNFKQEKMSTPTVLQFYTWCSAFVLIIKNVSY